MKKKIIAVILIVVGLAAIINAIGLKGYTKYKEKSLIDEFEKELEQKNPEEPGDTSQPEEAPSEPPKEEDLRPMLGGEKLAIIEIPVLKLKSIIVEGTDMNHLKYYVGHFTQTKMPGEYGNFAISGHSSNVYNEVFNGVNKLNNGDLIKIITLYGEYDYYVTRVYNVDPYQSEVLDDEEGKRMMTIVTCNELGDKRIIVQAEMREIPENPENQESPDNPEVTENPEINQ